jgi:hypothetical protein
MKGMDYTLQLKQTLFLSSYMKEFLISYIENHRRSLLREMIVFSRIAIGNMKVMQAGNQSSVEIQQFRTCAE